MIKLVIVTERNFLWKIGLTAILQKNNDISIVGDVNHGKELISLCGMKNPDIIVLDEFLKDMTGNQVLSILKKFNINIPVLFLSHSSHEEDIRRAFKLGAKGYLLKSSTVEQFQDAIYTVSQMGEWCSPTCPPNLFRSIVSNTNSQEKKSLTQRELEVLTLIVKGYNNIEISDSLNLSINTVQNHISNMYSKLNIHERVKMVHFAISNGLVEI